MNYKNLFKFTGLMLTVALFFTACSQDESAMEEKVLISDETVADEPIVYTLHLNCEAPSYEENGTRAATNWSNGSIVYLRFGSVAGTATYSSSTGLWTVSTTGTLSTTTSETNCEAYYFENPGTATQTQVNLKETTAIYKGTGKYTHPTSTDIYVNATLDPVTWRLRFNGGNVTLLGSESDLNYNSIFNRSTGEFTTSKMNDLNLTSNEYVYGVFASSTSDNIITVSTDNVYYRTIKASELETKKSYFFSAPSASNFSQKNWELKDPINPNAWINTKDFCAFTDAMVTQWEVGSDVATFNYLVYSKNEAESYTDEELVNEIYSRDPYTTEYTDYSFAKWQLSSNTEYYLCAVAKDTEGIRGPVHRYAFKTLSESLPYAEISNIAAETDTKWTFDIALKNNAEAYYLTTSVDEDDFTGNWHWWAYYSYLWATTGQLTARTWSSVALTLNSGSCNVITICTWGIDSNNNIGNCNIAYGSVSSSARQRNISDKNDKDKEVMSKEDMKKKFKHTNLNLIGQY